MHFMTMPLLARTLYTPILHDYFSICLNSFFARSHAHMMIGYKARLLDTSILYIYIVSSRYVQFTVITLASAVMMLLITLIMLVVGYDIIPVVFEQLPLDIIDNEFHQRGLAWVHRDDAKEIYEVRAVRMACDCCTGHISLLSPSLSRSPSLPSSLFLSLPLSHSLSVSFSLSLRHHPCCVRATSA